MGLRQAFDEMVEYGVPGEKWEGSEDQKKQEARKNMLSSLPALEVVMGHGVFDIIVDPEKMAVVDENGNIEVRLEKCDSLENVIEKYSKYQRECAEEFGTFEFIKVREKSIVR